MKRFALSGERLLTTMRGSQIYPTLRLAVTELLQTLACWTTLGPAGSLVNYLVELDAGDRDQCLSREGALLSSMCTVASSPNSWEAKPFGDSYYLIRTALNTLFPL